MEKRNKHGQWFIIRLWSLIGIFSIVLFVCFGYSPTPPGTPPEAVLNSERYQDVAGMAESMDALIVQLEALGRGSANETQSEPLAQGDM